MQPRTIRWALALGAGLLALGGRNVQAQLTPIGGTSASNTSAYTTPSTTTAPMGLYSNPYFNPATNPYMNPYLNPSMMMGPSLNMNRTAMGMMMLGNLQNSNGIGSGKLGGPNATLPGRTSARSRKAAGSGQEPMNVSNTPGGSAARYFGAMRTSSAGVNRFYNRQSPR